MGTWVSSPAYAAVVQTLIATRRDRGVTQRELATRLGKPRSFVSKIEAGERRVDVAEFIEIVRAAGGDERTAFDSLLARLHNDAQGALDT